MDTRPEHKPQGKSFHVLFVCSGNTCRSPMAQVIAEAVAGELAMERIVFSSAGTSAGEGLPASQGALGAARRHGLTLEEHASTPLSAKLVAEADLILTMGPHHLSRVEELGGSGKSELLGGFAESGEAVGRDLSVPDPFGGRDEVYEDTFRTLDVFVRKAMHRLAEDEEVRG